MRVRARHITLTALGLVACVAAGCAPGTDVAARADTPAPGAYLGVETQLLQDDLVRFLVRMRDPNGQAALEDYARCAAAQYALIRGYGFARHVRTQLSKGQGGVWQADAVYTISPALPRGVQTIDAEVVVESCAGQGIPTV
ncbi:MAG: hypothetical protein JXJ18_02570 [Rhodobacteraceae bacterium]|nr:hypothetical protein [Paracoccaceae bacterium]